jgi:hypothetical protein
MDAIARFRKLSIRRAMTPGARLESCPDYFILLLLSLHSEFPSARKFTEREVNVRLYRCGS